MSDEYECNLCGFSDPDESVVRTHVTRSSDAKHRDRNGNEPGVINLPERVTRESGRSTYTGPPSGIDARAEPEQGIQDRQTGVGLPARIDPNELTEKQEAILKTAASNPKTTTTRIAKSVGSGVEYVREILRRYDIELDSNKTTTDSELINDIKRVSQIYGRSPSSREYAKRGEFSPNTVINRFGSWNDALEKSGLKRRESNLSDGELIRDIRRVGNKLGETPTRSDYKIYGRHSAWAVRNHFGSWNDGLKKAGFDTRPKGERISADDCIEDIRLVADKLGHSPTFREYDEHGKYSSGTAKNRFGSWSSAVKSAGFDPTKTGENSVGGLPRAATDGGDS